MSLNLSGQCKEKETKPHKALRLHHLQDYGVKGCVHELDGFHCLVIAGSLMQHLTNVEHVIEVVHLLQKNGISMAITS